MICQIAKEIIEFLDLLFGFGDFGENPCFSQGAKLVPDRLEVPVPKGAAWHEILWFFSSRWNRNSLNKNITQLPSVCPISWAKHPKNSKHLAMYPDLFAKYSDHHLPMDLDWSMDLERSMDPSLRTFQVLVHSMDLRSHPMDHQRLHTKMNVTHDSWGFHRYHGNHGIQTCNQRWKLKTRSPKFRNRPDLNQSNLTPKDQRRDQRRSNSGRPPDKSIHFETIENGKVHSCKGNEGWCLRIRSYLKQDTFWAQKVGPDDLQWCCSSSLRCIFLCKKSVTDL